MDKKSSWVFHDPSRKRWLWARMLGLAAAAIVAACAVAFIFTLVTIPALPRIPEIAGTIRRTLTAAVPRPPRRDARLREFLLSRSRRALMREIDTEKKTAAAARNGRNIVAAFYAPWQPTGINSLNANIDDMTHVLPAWLRVSKDGTGLDFTDWTPETNPRNDDVIDVARTHGVAIDPVLTNAEQSVFDPDRVHLLFSDPAREQRLAVAVRDWLLQNKFHGLNVDFENLRPEDAKHVPEFLALLRNMLRPAGLELSVDLEGNRERFSWKEAAANVDFVILEAYEEHSSYGKPGAIASFGWYRGILARALSQIPADKMVLGLANYAYDWREGDDQATVLSYQQALYTAKENSATKAQGTELIDFDAALLNPTFDYTDSADAQHEVWMLDAVTAANQWNVARLFGVRGAAIWALGLEDPSVWSFLNRRDVTSRADFSKLEHISFPYAVDFVGEGEILNVAALPSTGARAIDVDPATNVCLDERYQSLPTEFILHRSGFHPREVALTIDDGPSADYTGKILDDLERLGVHATFFLIGENAEKNPDLVKRIWRDGNEIGNHTFTHPNMAEVSMRRAKLEMNTTQRVFQSLLGRSTVLFRPPYNADAEPTTGEEVEPIIRGAELGYITVGESIDPQDWNPTITQPDGTKRPRTAQDIARDIINGVRSGRGNCVLLHDAGGDRSATVEALRMAVPLLKSEGYKFVTVSELAGISRDEVNPKVATNDALLLGNDRVVFESAYLFDLTLSLVFLIAIALGTLKIVSITILAFRARRLENLRTFDETFVPLCTVVIAAYNEAAVIERTISGLMSSTHMPDEIIVVDDGSSDDTSGAVQRAIARWPIVRLIRQENQGKAAALNHGIASARGDILVCLDADTIFAPETIARLVRHFADPKVGAVAGNVKVGNRINLATNWQSIEYITSQNLDRRAWAMLNAVTVVPGAVGAWRREAVVAVGGYESDTMAEDMDLTWRVRVAGWRVENESDALAFTEAPDNFKALYKQRFRWAFGTLQSLWKHRHDLGRESYFGWLMLPSLWLFQIAFQLLSPVVDLQVAYALVTSLVPFVYDGVTEHVWSLPKGSIESLTFVGVTFFFFTIVELAGAWLAFGIEGEPRKPLLTMPLQRFVYRQLMYAVIWRSVKTAVKGIRTGWGKLDRKNTVSFQTER